MEAFAISSVLLLATVRAFGRARQADKISTEVSGGPRFYHPEFGLSRHIL
jgi:hypothetical protein